MVVVFLQGDAGQSGLPGTMGSAGKTVSKSSACYTCYNTVGVKSVVSLSFSLSHHRVNAENRERWDLLDPSVSL